ncbi:MAG: MFS transporter [Microbacteriaceae bacterium]|nr:MFS transporter [Microbacteriaceae bacterium]
MPRQPFPTAKLLVIAGAIFVCVSSEFLPTGILPELARGVGVTEATAGLLVSVFAFTVALSTIPLTRLTHRYPRKWLMVATLGIFAATNVLCALAPDFAWLIVGRVVGGLAHGVFWAVTTPYAARLVRPNQIVRAASITTAGGTLAFILGVPMGAAIGHAVGWRLSFVVMASLIVVFALLVVVFLPPVEHRVTLATGEIALPARRDPTLRLVLLVCSIIVLAVLGQNTLSTYIAPWLLEVPQVEPEQLASVLFLGGIGGAVALIISALVGDKDPHRVLLGGLAGLVAVGILLGLFGSTGWPGVLVYILWGVVFGIVPPLAQGLMMRDVSKRLRDMAAAALTTSFNVAIGGGALIGSFVLAGLGLAWLPWFLAGFALLAFVLLAVETFRVRRAETPDA